MKLDTFEDCVKATREIMEAACVDTAKKMGLPKPVIREEITPDGIRLVVVWFDGEETNEAILTRTDHEKSVAE